MVAGSARGRRLDAPPGDATRPTSDRVRQAIFNALHSLGALDGARVIDAFAGSGALGIEAMSRGAAQVTFAEPDPTARSVVVANLATTGLADRAVVLSGDGQRAIAGDGPWDLILLDPPYSFDQWGELLEVVATTLAPDGVVVVESDREIALPETLAVLRMKQYGGTVVMFVTPTGACS
ncbi:MAG: 16S rRNA (guanine(966)-N(2))-methyltransferase RsmD [Aquihabitans sp.]